MKSKESGPKTKKELKRRIKTKYRKTDAHKEIYDKEYHEVSYRGICPICGSRID